MYVYRKNPLRAKSLQFCPTPCDPMDCSRSGSSVHGIDSPVKNTGVSCHALMPCTRAMHDPGGLSQSWI